MEADREASRKSRGDRPPRGSIGRVTRVAILGAGLMGSQIGCEYALAGYPVVFVVRERAAAEARVQSALELVERHRLADPQRTEQARSLMSFAEGLVSADGHFDLIVESLPEQLELKAQVLGELCASQPDAIVASNTSSISISALGEAAGVAERILGTHYWNPPLLMALVEVVAGERTEAGLLERVLAMLRRAGKRAVVLDSEVPGLLWNRLQLALLRECLWLVENGVATPETIDQVMRDGLARRWRLTGPFQTVGLGGAQTFDAIAENLFPVLSDAHHVSGFEGHVPSDRRLLADLREQRDAALAQELRSERGASERPGRGALAKALP
jgi:3-hydroxybutyryl-CoA dehydrogenase